jgi:tetratricopeptide (TPR) repeat protein
MRRESHWLALALGIGLASVGALMAYVLAGGPWAVAGAIIGAVAGAFAPSVYDGVRNRDARRQVWHGTVEPSLPASWARLLDPRRELVGFVGRENALTALIEWCKDDRAERLRLVTGQGGVGKTRLAVQLVAHMKKLGWRCERITDGKEGDVITALRAVTHDRAVLVVDYAETRIGLSQMLTALVGDEGARVKVLLLARSAGDWWAQLGLTTAAVWDLVQAANSKLLVLSPVLDVDLSDANVVALAVESFARELGLSKKTVQIYGDSDRRRRRVLDLHAAALVAVLDTASAPIVRVDIRTVLGELLRHEQHFWYSSARAYGLSDGPDGLSPRSLRQIIAAGCLLGAATEAEARALPGRVPGVTPSVKVAAWLRELYPPSHEEPDWIGSLQPDRLAELHTVQELAASSELANACLTDLDSRQARSAVTLLARASSDDPEAKDLLSRILPNVARFIAALDAPRETLMAIFNVIPFPTVILAPAAAALGLRIRELLPDGAQLEERAYWSSVVAARLFELGRLAEAVAIMEEAVEIRRQLAAANRYRNRPTLAAVLVFLGGWYSEMGREADALLLAEETVTIYRELAASNPDRYRSSLAISLKNLGIRLSEELGRSEEALPVTEEAVTIFRELAAANPDRDGLGRCLHSLGNRLSELDRSEEALPVTEEAVTIFRELAAANPDSYRGDFAVGLHGLGYRLSELGRWEEALAVAEEAIQIRRELAAVIPDRYRPDLAQSLSSRGFQLSKLGRSEEALPVTKEAVTIFRELAASNPDRYRPGLAQSLYHLGFRFSEVGRPADALAVAEEAVQIRRELAAVIPDRYRPGLAQSLDSLGIRLSELGRPADALPVTEEAVTIFRELAASNPDRYRPDVAESLDSLGIRLSELGRPADALPVTEEAVTIFRELAASNPDRYRSGLAESLSNFAGLLTALERKVDAAAVRFEAEKFAQQPDR